MNINYQLDASLIIYFILMYFWQLSNVFILFNSLFFVPQIIHNAQRGNNPKFIPEYIFGILGSTLLIPVYLIYLLKSSTFEVALATFGDCSRPLYSALSGLACMCSKYFYCSSNSNMAHDRLFQNVFCQSNIIIIKTSRCSLTVWI